MCAVCGVHVIACNLISLDNLLKPAMVAAAIRQPHRLRTPGIGRSEPLIR